MKIGMLTSGGDCQGLNAALRAVAKSLYGKIQGLELYGIADGYRGLIEGEMRPMRPEDFSGIIRQGGTILGASRQPFKKMRAPNGESADKLSLMLQNYSQSGFDALVILGGNGTHKTANLLAENGVNVVTLPKTIDNDVYGTELSFGFDSAVEKATSVIDAVHTTAASHGRVFVLELMGHKTGWITLYAGIAGGADVILLPELPYAPEKVLEAIEARNRSGKNFSIIAIAEGALTKTDAALGKKEREREWGGSTSGGRLARYLSERLENEVRTIVPGHFQRGGEPTATDRVLCSRFGAMAAELAAQRRFGLMTALKGGEIIAVPISEVAGRLRTVPPETQELKHARLLGIATGD